MNYAQINKYDIANGPGIRVSLFVSGCDLHCPGCHNEKAWDYEYGTKYTSDTENQIITALSDSNISGLSILGGEPLSENNYATVYQLIKVVRIKYPDKNIWLWTGLTMETIEKVNELMKIINAVDFVVEGPYIESLKDLRIRYRGSRNQRVYDVKNKKFIDVDNY